MRSCPACLGHGSCLPAPPGLPRTPQAHSSGRRETCRPQVVKLCTLALPCGILPPVLPTATTPVLPFTRPLLLPASSPGPLRFGLSAARSRSAGCRLRRRRRRQRLARHLVGAPMGPLALAGTVPRLRTPGSQADNRTWRLVSRGITNTGLWQITAYTAPQSDPSTKRRNALTHVHHPARHQHADVRLSPL